MSHPRRCEFERHELRPFQKEALLALGARERRSAPVDLLCIAPTGSGKSLVYERLAAQGRRTLLISPLVSLARQQHQRLRAAGVDARLHAGGERQAPPGREGAWILSPESLHADSIRDAIRRFRPQLLVVDECHCLWEWGEGFRPAFRRIPELLEGGIDSLWLSATLPIEARAQIERELLSRGRKLVKQGKFELPAGLELHVARKEWPERADALLRATRRLEGSGLVFVQSRESAERLARLLESTGIACAAYHAGLSAEERVVIEARLRERKLRVVVSTSAFGMGMDYAHLRWVILWQAPPTLLALSQMAGRVGRAGQNGRVIVFWSEEDFRLIAWMAQRSESKVSEIFNVKNFLTQARCRREMLGNFFNGTEFQRSECKRCDICLSLIVS